VPLEGKRFWKLAVRSRGGHVPLLTRGERDARYLGVHVTIRPVPSAAERGMIAAEATR
jgi:hypothetical protein